MICNQILALCNIKILEAKNAVELAAQILFSEVWRLARIWSQRETYLVIKGIKFSSWNKILNDFADRI